jgi:Zn-dependent M16 (insulinase) family peptidase
MFLEKAGERYRDFTVTKALPIKELQCMLRELVHEPSGAMVMHIENEDPENLFCLSFKTLPNSSNGAPHILEHTVLCGSRKYPVKDPFFAMSRRSLNTFMNALTGADFTCYPAASQVEKDFYNLLDVYVDAVFHPQLKEMSFLQEGHRLEFSDPEDPKSTLECKGIVYNEMKGSMASPDARLWHELMALITPDLPYAYNSGGDPKEIPNLSYAELIQFHETYYHPSRCLFFFYGNFSLKKHLDYLSERVLKNVPIQQPIPLLPLQKRFSAPVKKEIPYPVSDRDSLESKFIVAFAWLTVPIIEQNDLLALAVLDCALMDTDASPLKAHLLSTNLCVSADAYLDAEMSEVPYCIVCKGCKEDKVEELEEALKDGLKKIATEGVPRYLIDAAIHQIEFSRTEISGDHSPFGLTLFMRSGLAKQNGCPAENALTLHSLFERLLKDIENPEFFKNLIKKYYIDNSHFVRLIMRPDPELTLKEAENEKQMLKSIQQSLSKDETKRILLQTADLAKYQKMTEEQKSDCLPKVTIADVPKLIRDFPLQQSKHNSLQVFHHPCFTNQILYVDLFMDLPKVEYDHLPYLQLLLSMLSELGAGKRTYVENLEYLQAHTGGIGFSYSLHTPVDPHKPMKPCIHLRGKSLGRKADKLLTLMYEEITAARLDEKARIAELIEQTRVHLGNRLLRNASRYAILMAQSGLSEASFINNICHGLPYYHAIGKIAEKAKTDLDSVVQLLQTLYEKLFTLSSPQLVLSCDSDLKDMIEKEGYYGLENLQTKEAIAWGSMGIDKLPSQTRTIASPVAFNAEAFQAPSYLHADAPALHLASQLFDNLILHPSIREKGGAYGSGATYNPLLGQFIFHSYRDPHIAASWNSFHIAVETIAQGHFTSEDLEEAKLGLIQNFDAPVSPGNRAVTAFAWMREGRTPAVRQHYRDSLLAMQKDTIAKAVETHLLPILKKGVFVSFAGKDLIEREKQGLTSLGKPLESFMV